jgi:hypothetical protein
MKRSRLKRKGSHARRQRLKPLTKNEYELSDIFEEIELGTANEIVQENVAYVLKREKLLGKDMKVIVPATGLVEMTPDFVQCDFEVFKGHNDIVAGGTAYSHISNGELMDLTVEVYPKGMGMI